MSGISRQAYFETGLDVLSDLGYGGLKLAEVCARLGVTTGSFYHYFSSWSVYTRSLIDHWMQATTVRAVAILRTETDPRKRIDGLLREALALPHGAEAAIRIWGSLDKDVYKVQLAVDQQRFDILYESALDILQNERQAQLFAEWGMYTLVGYEQATLPRDPTALQWIGSRLLDALDSGRVAVTPHGD
jgi:AcrR family transcriptional regulator